MQLDAHLLRGTLGLVTWKPQVSEGCSGAVFPFLLRELPIPSIIDNPCMCAGHSFVHYRNLSLFVDHFVKVRIKGKISTEVYLTLLELIDALLELIDAHSCIILDNLNIRKGHIL